jgi:hypothetical protein
MGVRRRRGGDAAEGVMRQRLLIAGEIGGNTVTRQQIAADVFRPTNQPTFTVEQFGEMEFREVRSLLSAVSFLFLFLWCFLRELAASPILYPVVYYGEFTNSILRFLRGPCVTC